MDDWWSSITTTALKFADEIGDTINSQMKIAQEQIEAEQRAMTKDLNGEHSDTAKLYLPWESSSESKSIISQDLMEKVLLICTEDSCFVEPIAVEQLHRCTFSFDNYVPIIMKLLEVDFDLKRMHAKHSPKMDEMVFWKNYFDRVAFLRLKLGMVTEDLPYSFDYSINLQKSVAEVKFSEVFPEYLADRLSDQSFTQSVKSIRTSRETSSAQPFQPSNQVSSQHLAEQPVDEDEFLKESVTVTSKKLNDEIDEELKNFDIAQVEKESQDKLIKEKEKLVDDELEVELDELDVNIEGEVDLDMDDLLIDEDVDVDEGSGVMISASKSTNSSLEIVER